MWGLGLENTNLSATNIKFHKCFADRGNIIKTHLSCIIMIVGSTLKRFIVTSISF